MLTKTSHWSLAWAALTQGRMWEEATGASTKQKQTPQILQTFTSLKSRKFSLYFLLLTETRKRKPQAKFAITDSSLHIFIAPGPEQR
jgi:hypothetical protein